MTTNSIFTRRFALCTSLVTVVSLLGSAGPAQAAGAPLLWGKLQSGPYAVGFKTYWRYDRARVYDPPYRANGTEVAVHPRPMLVNIWYPARRTAAAKPMLYREYLEVSSKEPFLRRFAARLVAFNRDVIRWEVLGKPLAALSVAEKQLMERLMQARTAAFRNATPSPGLFPVVVNHQGLGGAFEDNAVLFEWLASHGYVVANSAYQSENPAYLNIDGDLALSVKDMDFLVNELQSWPNADLQKIGAIGQSYGGQAVMAWRAESNSPVDALVSLDATLEYSPLGDPRRSRLMARLGQTDRMAAPMLLFAQKDRSPEFGHYDPMKYADRYYVSVNHLLHNDFISHGAIGSELAPANRPNPPEPKAIRPTYEQVCRYTLQFFNAYLKQDRAAFAFLQAAAKKEIGDQSGLALRYRAAASLPPTAKQLTDLVLQQGVEKGLQLGRRFPGDLTEDVLQQASYTLKELGKPSDAIAMLQLSAELHPDSAEAHELLADAWIGKGERVPAIEAYRKAVGLRVKIGQPADPAWERLKASRLAPRIVVTAPGPQTIQLRWQPLPSAAGYMVYRRSTDTPNAALVRLTSHPVTDTTFTDSAANRVNGSSYAVAAVFPSAGRVIEAPAIPVGPVSGMPPPGWTVGSLSEGERTGSAVFDPATGELTIRGSGADIWGEADECFYMHQEVEGDFQVTVRALSRPTNTDAWAKAGLMVREALDPGARTAFLIATPESGLLFQWRREMAKEESCGSKLVIEHRRLQVPITLRLSRRGNQIIPEVSLDDGKSFQPGGEPMQFSPSLSNKLFVGLAVTAHAPGKVSEARFSDLALHSGRFGDSQ
jgi:dienelactone hydrolase